MRTDDEEAAPDPMRPVPSESERLAVAAGVCALLSDPTRLQLLWTLTETEADVGQLTEACGASRTAVSQHLAKLRLAGLVESRKQSRHAIYRLSDGHLRRLVLEVLNHAEHVVTGEPFHD